MATTAIEDEALNPSALLTDAYIDGQWTVGEDSMRDVINPADGTVLTQVSVSTVAQCLTAVEAAGSAQKDWSQRPARERSEILMRAYFLMCRDESALAGLITRENGKSLADAKAEAKYAGEFFRWFAEECVRVPGDMRRSPAGHNWIMISHEPVGVCLLITPWNFPAAMATRKIAPALAAGCTVVLKPAMETPLTALYIARLLEEAGVPPGVVNVVLPKPAAPAVNAMLANARVRAVSFTGSTEVGRELLAESAKRIAKPSMELGGNAPFIVLNDADLDEAVEGFMLAKFRNGGAACTAANRIFLQSDIADDFVARITERVCRLQMGPGAEEGTDIGPMVSSAERNRVAALVDNAVAAGARVLVGGTIPDRDGFYYTPTVLDHVSPSSELARTEIFGPVAAIIRVESAEEAIDYANDTESGLVAYLYTRNFELGLSASRRLDTGMVGLNRGLVSDPAAPFGGSKQSGLGREGSREGMLEFMETKYIATPYL